MLSDLNNINYIRFIRKKIMRKYFFYSLVKTKKKKYILFDFFENQIDFIYVKNVKKKKFFKNLLYKSLFYIKINFINKDKDYFKFYNENSLKFREDFYAFTNFKSILKNKRLKKFNTFDLFCYNDTIDLNYLFKTLAVKKNYMFYPRYRGWFFNFFLNFNYHNYISIKNFNILNLDTVVLNQLYIFIKNYLIFNSISFLNMYFSLLISYNNYDDIDELYFFFINKNKLYNLDFNYDKYKYIQKNSIMNKFIILFNKFLTRKRMWRSSNFYYRFLQFLKWFVYNSYKFNFLLNNQTYNKFKNFKYNIKKKYLKNMKMQIRPKRTWFIFLNYFKSFYILKKSLFRSFSTLFYFLIKKYYLFYYFIIRIIYKFFYGIRFLILNNNLIVKKLIILKYFIIYLFYKKWLRLKNIRFKKSRYIINLKRIKFLLSKFYKVDYHNKATNLRLKEKRKFKKIKAKLHEKLHPGFKYKTKLTFFKRKRRKFKKFKLKNLKNLKEKDMLVGHNINRNWKYFKQKINIEFANKKKLTYDQKFCSFLKNTLIPRKCRYKFPFLFNNSKKDYLSLKKSNTILSSHNYYVMSVILRAFLIIYFSLYYSYLSYLNNNDKLLPFFDFSVIII